MNCCDFDFKIWLQSVVVFIYGLDSKSRWTVVTLTLRFGGKVLCCIQIWLRHKIQMDCCDFDFKIWLQSVVLYSKRLRQKIQMDCCDFDLKIWWQTVVLYSNMA